MDMAVPENGVQGYLPVSFGDISIDQLPDLGKRKPGIIFQLLRNKKFHNDIIPLGLVRKEAFNDNYIPKL
jgi:hypothetical protein